jgi:hypothetical protein
MYELMRGRQKQAYCKRCDERVVERGGLCTACIAELCAPSGGGGDAGH